MASTIPIPVAHAMTQSTEKPSNALKLSRELLVDASADGTILEVNSAWSRVLGWTDPEIRGKSFYDLVHPDDLQAMRQEMRRAAQSDEIAAFVTRHRHRDGSYRWISWCAAVEDDVICAAGHGITTETSAVKALQEGQERSRAGPASESSTKPSRGPAHDFNNLMQTIVASLELVRRLVAAGRAGETQPLIGRAIDAAQRASVLNEQLLSRSDRDPRQTGS